MAKEYDILTGQLSKEAKNNSGYVEIDVVKKKSAAGSLGKFFGMTIGALGIIIGTALCLTIIGILIGLPLAVVSFGIMINAQGFQQVKCPTCGKKHKVLKNKENFDCPKCRQFVVINWK